MEQDSFTAHIRSPKLHSIVVVLTISIYAPLLPHRKRGKTFFLGHSKGVSSLLFFISGPRYIE